MTIENAGSVDACWQALHTMHAALSETPILELFNQEPDRAGQFSCEAAGLYLDYSKNRISGGVRNALLTLAEEGGVPAAIDAMFSGERINRTEDRAVLHTALRDRSGRQVLLDGVDACAQATAERDRMLDFVSDVHSGTVTGYSGQPLDTVVNIGIGGSDLGPLMVTEALRPYGIDGRRSFFVSNVDGQHLADTLEQLDPARTLFIVASKTFTTQETMTNAHTALAWFKGQVEDDAAVASHFAALSTNADAVAEFGISADRTFGFWDWVGGRYSLWSAIGLSIALQIGKASFLELLDGAYAMDRHFAETELAQNMPVLLALVGLWNRNIEGMGCHAILPYDQHLHRFAAYLQQADMESNGKSVTMEGKPCERATGPVIFGEPGTNGQHAFYQLIHQGTDKLSADFIAPAVSQSEIGDHHAKLLANFLAQPRALMCGKSTQQVSEEMRAAGRSEDTIEALAAHRTFTGDRPSNSILMDRLTPASLGALIALYEHKIFVQGVIWGINSFDQWGVELGKELAREILPAIDTGPDSTTAVDGLDPSTTTQLAWINARRRET